jgi:hypothetical protein
VQSKGRIEQVQFVLADKKLIEMSDSCVVANCKGWYSKSKKLSDKETGQSEHLNNISTMNH